MNEKKSKPGVSSLLRYGVGNFNTFWEVKLGDTPEKLGGYVKERAQGFINNAEKELAKLDEYDAAGEPLNELIKLAQEDFQTGEQSELSGDESIFCLSKSVRTYTRAQVRAKQVINALTPPPEKLEDLMQEVV